MKFLLIRERQKRRKFVEKEARIFALKILINNTKVDPRIRWAATHRLWFFARFLSRCSNFNNRCFVTGRKRSYVRFFKLSRIKAREYALSQRLPYISKSSW
jgi:ribosomal protein S14